jgi:hypothetical protein
MASRPRNVGTCGFPKYPAPISPAAVLQEGRTAGPAYTIGAGRHRPPARPRVLRPRVFLTAGAMGRRRLTRARTPQSRSRSGTEGVDERLSNFASYQASGAANAPRPRVAGTLLLGHRGRSMPPDIWTGPHRRKDADRGGHQRDLPEMSHRRSDGAASLLRADAMRIDRRTMLLGVLTMALGDRRQVGAEASAGPHVTVHRAPT